ncbi:acyl-CoA dehydrogenase NM domain-like protein [Rickenella mellea]|uniref:Acyl-CoA dehydrogenase NM domain-like protein n=1 Tax=Rickenella mellea TaxID=50990 RepID=A0A4Y7PJY6_9AGAM|nr:acyl-CoA dehydrogenase NM domain-like protein [Rickenella mellea]
MTPASKVAGGRAKCFTREEVAKHSTSSSLYIIIDACIYDLTDFLHSHPGGSNILLSSSVAGKDSSQAFFSLHRAELLDDSRYSRLQVGVLDDEHSTIQRSADGENSSVPYAEPAWLSSGNTFRSPYYTDCHRQFQRAMRKFAHEFLKPDAIAREADGQRPNRRVLEKMAELNINCMRLGPGAHLRGRKLMDGLVNPEEFDYFHEMIIHQEISRCGPGTRGYTDALLTGLVIGLSPILNFGSAELKRKVVPEVLEGKKFICLAVTEAFAGSDVGGLRCRAMKSDDGKWWIVNGTKKWITNGTFADYFTVGCLTGPNSSRNFTVLLIPRTTGVKTRQIRTSYSTTAGTAYVTFDNVRVPVQNTIGREGEGLFVILSNFNHERWSMACATGATMRVAVEECLKYCTQHHVSGKPLISQPVIRGKLASMIANAEAYQTWLESLTYQMCHMSYKEQADKLAGPIALLKMFGTKCARQNARDATQMFGALAITDGGIGRIIENYRRTIPFDALLGGAEDVLADLGVRQVIRQMPPGTRL